MIVDSLIRESGKTFSWSGEYKGDLNTAFTLNTELGVLASFKPVILPAVLIVINGSRLASIRLNEYLDCILLAAVKKSSSLCRNFVFIIKK